VRARRYFGEKRLDVASVVDARKEPQGRAEALALLKRASRLVAARSGGRVEEVDLARKPPEADLLALVLGPTGNLRAPAFLIGRTLYVGFPREGFPELG
jgi:hypothetical protein